MTTEEVFRAQLKDAALACDWPAWDVTRSIFADWLGEQGSPEEHLARAPWRCVWTKKGENERQVRMPGSGQWETVRSSRLEVYLFEVACAPIKGNVGVGRHNANPLLCFAPGSLKLLRDVVREGTVKPVEFPPYAVQFSWCPLRKLYLHRQNDPSQKKLDTGRKDWPFGFLHLFAPRPAERTLFGALP